MKIRIITGRGWYMSYINNVFDVDKEKENGYLVTSIGGWRGTIYKEDAEVVEDEKSCDNCNYDKFNTSEETSCQNHVGICEYYEKWKQIEPTISKTEMVESCTTCLHRVDKPMELCVPCTQKTKNNWTMQDEIVTNLNGGKQSKNEWIKQGDGTTDDAKHYMTGKQQPIEIMQEKMTQEQFIGFLLGNVIKYSLRINHKDNDREDAGKCSQYAKWLVQAMDGDTIIPGGK